MELLHADTSIDATDSPTASSKLIVTPDFDTLLHWIPDTTSLTPDRMTRAGP